MMIATIFIKMSATSVLRDLERCATTLDWESFCARALDHAKAIENDFQILKGLTPVSARQLPAIEQDIV